MIKIVFLSDTHIRNYKYQKEYQWIFENELLPKIKIEKPDLIIHGGDIAHTKTQISPEYVQLASLLLQGLADIAPTRIIVGNHDANLKNPNRADAITPIVDMLNGDVEVWSKSEQVEFKGCIFNVFSLLEKDKWEKIESDKPVVGLYHGPIAGAKTDIGFLITHYEDGINEYLESCDFVMLGDIHKTYQIMGPEGNWVYPGSTIQQNFGETNDKGFVVWEIEDKRKFSVRHVKCHNPVPFVTIEYNGTVDEKKIPKGCRLRIRNCTNASNLEMKSIAESLQNKHALRSVSFVKSHNTDIAELSSSVESINIRDPKEQERLIRDYFKSRQIEIEDEELLFKINREKNLFVDNDEVLRNVNWSMNKLEWDNLFNYGEGNSFNLKTFSGILGIIGNNYSGKSSVIETMLYAIFNNTSKPVRKTIDLINQNKEESRAKVYTTVNGREYVIERKSTKLKRGADARTEVDFICNGEVINSLSRIETDRQIRKIFGSLEDFMMTSLSSQMNSMIFIEEGNKRRKEIIAKFLDLDFLDSKFKILKEKQFEIKNVIKKYAQIDYPFEISEYQRRRCLEDEKIEILSHDISLLESELEQKRESVYETKSKIVENVEHIDIKDINEKISQKQKRRSQIVQERDDLIDNLKAYQKQIEKLVEDNANVNIDVLKEQIRLFEEENESISEITKEIDSLREQLNFCNSESKILDDVPCNNAFPSCQFIVNANAARNEIVLVEKAIESKISELESRLAERKESAPYEEVELFEDRSREILKYRAAEEKTLSRISLIEKDLQIIDTIMSDLLNKVEQYELNQKDIQNNSNLLEKIKILEKEARLISEELVKKREFLNECHKQQGYLNQKIDSLKEDKEYYDKLSKYLDAYSLLCQVYHTNGLSYYIIKNRLPILNREISSILSGIVDFEVSFEESGKKLDILIRHPNYDARPIELGSGAEKTIASMAIRLALLNISSLPKSDLFILDEPATALDAENMEGFISLLAMMKTQFKTVILISHLESLRDIVDEVIDIEQVDGYAHLEV